MIHHWFLYVRSPYICIQPAQKKKKILEMKKQFSKTPLNSLGFFLILFTKIGWKSVDKLIKQKIQHRKFLKIYKRSNFKLSRITNSCSYIKRRVGRSVGSTEKLLTNFVFVANLFYELNFMLWLCIKTMKNIAHFHTSQLVPCSVVA